MCAKKWGRAGKITKFIKIYEGDYFNKITFKAGSAKCYSLEPKMPQIPQAINNDRFKDT